MVLSMYLWRSEGLTERNMSILQAAGDAIARFGGPWMDSIRNKNVPKGHLPICVQIDEDERAPDIAGARTRLLMVDMQVDKNGIKSYDVMRE